VFVTLSIVLERMRYEGVVDMFQTVKILRTQRPAMVQNEVRVKTAVIIILITAHLYTAATWPEERNRVAAALPPKFLFYLFVRKFSSKNAKSWE